MELLAGLLASVKLMKRVGGRRRGEPQGGPVTQVGSCLRSWMGQDHDGRPVPSGLLSDTKVRGYGSLFNGGGQHWGLLSPAKGTQSMTEKP